MPGRPTISHHRHPYDSIRYFVDFKNADMITKLHVLTITAAEQQTMNFYMNVGGFYTSDIGRKLYQEIGMVEEQHVTQYGSLIDPNSTWLENLLMHEYNECYLYYSCYCDETDKYVKSFFEQCFCQEVAHLHKAAELLKKYENKEWQQVIPNGEFPELLSLGPNIEYVRNVMQTVNFTALREEYVPVNDLQSNADFFRYQNIVNRDVPNVPSHKVICNYINKNGMDYRFEVAPNPIPALQNRRCDNTTVGRKPM